MQISKHYLGMAGIVALILLFSCNRRPKPVPDGGPCEYETITLGAEVFKIINMDDDFSDVVFVVQKSELLTDTILYSDNFGKYISGKEIKEYGIEKGMIFKYLIKDISKGNCNPHLESLTLEKMQ